MHGGVLVGSTHRHRSFLKVALKVVAVASSDGRDHIADGRKMEDRLKSL